jgi:cytochrome c oxidase subunit 3
MSASHPALQHQFSDLHQQREAATLGMWVFLATELLIFGGVFTAFAVYRYWYPEAFESASVHLDWQIGAVNTVVLLASSLTMVLAVHAAQTGQQQRIVAFMLATAALGTLFLLIKAYEYYQDYTKALVPLLRFDPNEWRSQNIEPNHVTLFLIFYYVMTGLHAVHLTAGIGIVLVVAWLAKGGRYSPAYYNPVEVTGLYWHFIDVIWIFLLPMLYLIGTH